jgi:D-threo-aldose 1-dehydrogenase
MDPLATRPLGRTGVSVTQLGLGGASIGSMFQRVPEEDAVATVRQGWTEGLGFFDTAPWNGRGDSESLM